MRVTYKVGLWGILTIVAGCARAVRAPEQPAKVAAATPVPVVAAAVDVAQVSAPKDLVAVARAERLDSAAATLARWMNLPFDLRMLDALGPGLSQTLLVDAPVEAAVALAENGDAELPQPYAVFSAGLASVDAGRRLFEKFGRKLEEASPGVWLTSDESPMACGLGPALGRTQARVVCGARRIDVENLLPYATRGLPLLALGTSDLRIELNMAPIRERYGQRLRQGRAVAVPLAMHALGLSDARVSTLVSEGLTAIGDEIVDVVDDVDKVTIDGKIASGSERIEFTTAVDFGQSHSWSARTLADAKTRSALPPALFFKLPTDAGMASFASPPNPKSVEKIVQWFGSLLDAALSHAAVNATARDKLVRSMEQISEVPHGPAVCAASRGPSDATSTASRDPLMESMNAWQICATDQLPAAKMTAALDAWAKVVADPAFRKFVGEKTLVFRRNAVPAGVPAGSVAYEVKLDLQALGKVIQKAAAASSAATSKTKETEAKPAPARSIFILIVPDQNRTWWGFGTDAKLMVSHLLAAKKSESEPHTNAVAELEWLTHEPVVGGGYFTTAYFAAPFIKGMNRALRDTPKGSQKSHLDDALSTAPHHGTTPIPFTWSLKGEAPAAELRFTIMFERAVIEDLASIGGQALAAAHY